MEVQFPSNFHCFVEHRKRDHKKTRITANFTVASPFETIIIYWSAVTQQMYTLQNHFACDRYSLNMYNWLRGINNSDLILIKNTRIIGALNALKSISSCVVNPSEPSFCFSLFPPFFYLYLFTHTSLNYD